MIYRGGCLVHLQQYDAALEDVNLAVASGFLTNKLAMNSLSRAYTIKGNTYYNHDIYMFRL